ncbi:hypothetical protein K2X05_09015, partial [bacterium]|nr:hypothetical protein [bacterium]
MHWNKALLAFVLVIFLAVGYLMIRDLRAYDQSSAIALAFMPGNMSQSHAFLEKQCVSCHTPNQGVSASGCISCHS